MTVLRKHDGISPADFLMDREISAGAKGVLAMVYAMGADTDIKELQRMTMDSPSDVIYYAREAEEAGYIDISYVKRRKA